MKWRRESVAEGDFGRLPASIARIWNHLFGIRACFERSDMSLRMSVCLSASSYTTAKLFTPTQRAVELYFLVYFF